MTTDTTPIDISRMPELVRLVEEVEVTKKPRELKRDDKVVAVLSPVETKKTQQTNHQAIEETLALAGAWKELDFDEMIEQLDRIRHESKPTPPLLPSLSHWYETEWQQQVFLSMVRWSNI